VGNDKLVLSNLKLNRFFQVGITTDRNDQMCLIIDVDKKPRKEQTTSERREEKKKNIKKSDYNSTQHKYTHK